MIEPENCKLFAIGTAYVATQFLSAIASVTAVEGIDKWIERGGTALCVVLMIIAWKSEKKERIENADKHAKQLDAIMNRDRELHEKGTESRVQLTCAMEKHSEAVEKLGNIIEKKLP